MKKLTMLLLVIVTLFTSTSVLAYSEANGIILNGNPLKMDVKPVIIEGRTLVPARALLEALGLKVSWNNTERIVKAEKTGVQLQLVVSNNKWDSRNIYNGMQFVNEETPPTIINNRTLIPARFVSEILGLDVKWNSKNKTVIIQENKSKTKLSIDDAYKVLNKQYPQDENSSFFYLPFGGYAHNDTYIMANYYVFGAIDIGEDYESISDMNFCIHKNTGEIRFYNPQ